MAQTDKAAPDWERIEADYRAGVLSIISNRKFLGLMLFAWEAVLRLDARYGTARMVPLSRDFYPIPIRAARGSN